MSSRRLGDWIEGFLEYTENTQPPRTYRTFAAISTIASALKRKCRLDWGLEPYYPNMYIVLIGPSGTGKGQAIMPARKILDRAGITVAADATSRERLIRALAKADETTLHPEDGGMDPHHSLTISSAELTVFLGYRNLQLMTDMIDWYDCRSKWDYETKWCGEDHMTGVFVNLIAGTTPEAIVSSLSKEAIGGGLTSRMIFVWEPKKGKLVTRHIMTDRERQLEEDLIVDLEKIHMLKGSFKTTEEFDRVWDKWCKDHDEYRPFKDPRFDGYFNRRSTHVLKLCMVVNVSRGDDMLITVEDLARAENLIKWVEKKMPNTFAGVGESPHAGLIERVMQEIGLRKRVTFGELMAMFHYDADRLTMDRIIQTLKAEHFIRVGHEGTEEVITYTKKEERDE